MSKLRFHHDSAVNHEYCFVPKGSCSPTVGIHHSRVPRQHQQFKQLWQAGQEFPPGLHVRVLYYIHVAMLEFLEWCFFLLTSSSQENHSQDSLKFSQKRFPKNDVPKSIPPDFSLFFLAPIFPNPYMLHGTFTYMYPKNDPVMQVHIPALKEHP